MVSNMDPSSDANACPKTPFHIFTSLRYDPLLLSSAHNTQPLLNPIHPNPTPFYMFLYHRDRLLEAAQHFEFPLVVEKLQDGKSLHADLLQEIERYFEHETKEGGGKVGEKKPLKVRLLFDKVGTMSVDCTPVAAVSLETLYPSSLDPPSSSKEPHPAAKPFTPSPLTGGALHLGPTDSLPSSSSNSNNEPVPWALRLDKEPTPSSPFTLLKTTVRDLYNTSRSRALPTNPQNPKFVEVMLYNECNEITEGSITSLYFSRGGRWVTPPVGVPTGSFDSSTLKGGDGERWDEGEMRKPFAGRWGHSVRSAKVGAGGQRGTTRRWALSRGLCMEEPVGVDSVRVGEGVWVSNGVVGFGFGRVVE
jgi:hypothetical protein